MNNNTRFKDSKLEKICKSIKLPTLAKTEDIYLDMLEIIISQQLSGKVAKVIYNRFLELFENKYPAPKTLLYTDDNVLRSVGLSQGKSSYVKNLAGFALSNDLGVSRIESLNDEEIVTLLTQVKGIGRWSVEMLLIFSLQRPNVFPYDDLVIRKSMIDIYKFKTEGKALIAEMMSIAEKWEPNRTLASRYLWAYHGTKKDINKKNC
ncbi:MAG: DNA-3-methyladenine glycosylase 2 family protein [Bacteroidales bacterium]|nr:MAG: DNA-3-methyladenine glycosylase 2 family protein [Bacteroidales bacterium]